MLWLPAIPAVVTMLLAVSTRRILPSLLAGLLTGAMLKAGAFIGGLRLAVGDITAVLTDPGNMRVLLFLYLFSALVELTRRSGGVEAFAAFMSRFVKSRRGFYAALWGLLPLTFIDCGFRVMAAGAILRPLAREHRIPRTRFALMLNNTASPFTELVPVATTFVAYNIGLIQQGLRAAGHHEASAYGLLLHAIPYEFFSLTVLLMTAAMIFWRPPQPHGQPPDAAQDAGKQGAGDTALPPRVLNLLLPLAFLLVITFSLIGMAVHERWDAAASWDALMQSLPVGQLMLDSIFLSLLATGLLYLVQGYSSQRLTNDVIKGGNAIMPTLAILILAWPLSNISQDLGLGQLVEQVISGSLPAYLVPLSMFAITGIVAYVTGSSWGAEALVMPAAIPLALVSDVNLPLTIAAVITGGTFGDVTSPLAGMVYMSAQVTHARHDHYVKRAFFYNSIAAAVAALLFLGAGWLL